MNDNYINYLIPYNPSSLRWDHVNLHVCMNPSTNLMDPLFSSFMNQYTILYKGQYTSTSTSPEAFSKYLRISFKPNRRQQIIELPLSSHPEDFGMDKWLEREYIDYHSLSIFPDWNDKYNYYHMIPSDQTENFLFMDQLSDEQRKAKLAEYDNDRAFFIYLVFNQYKWHYWAKYMTLNFKPVKEPLFYHDIEVNKFFRNSEDQVESVGGSKFKISEADKNKLFTKLKRTLDKSYLEENVNQENEEYLEGKRQKETVIDPTVSAAEQNFVSIYSNKGWQDRFDTEEDYIEDSHETMLMSPKTTELFQKKQYEDSSEFIKLNRQIKVSGNLWLHGPRHYDLFDGERMPAHPDFKHFQVYYLTFYYRIDPFNIIQLMVPIIKGDFESQTVYNRYYEPSLYLDDYGENYIANHQNAGMWQAAWWSNNNWIGPQYEEIVNKQAFNGIKFIPWDATQLPELNRSGRIETYQAVNFAYVNIMSQIAEYKFEAVDTYSTPFCSPKIQEWWNTTYLPKVLRISPQDCFAYRVYIYNRDSGFGDSDYLSDLYWSK